jgi:hypothetical protein
LVRCLEGKLYVTRSCSFVGVLALSLCFPVALLGAQTTSPHDAIVGAWTLNTELSDAPPARPDGNRGDGRAAGRGGRSGGGRRGGLGGGFGRGGGAGARRGPADEDRMRQMNAMRELMEAPDRLTITRTDTMVILTAGDGRAMRLQPDGKAVKDESTKFERRTRWDGEKLVSEVSGLPRGKITETYSPDPEHHRLTVTLKIDGMRGPDGEATRTVTRVYDAEPR